MLYAPTMLIPTVRNLLSYIYDNKSSICSFVVDHMQGFIDKFDTYTKLDYKSASKLPCLIEASNEGGHGAVIDKIALNSFQKLQSEASTGVKFEDSRLKSTCYGGTCSAQSLNFADQFFSSKVTPLDQRVITVAKKCTRSNKELRSQQAALNAIAEDSSNRVKDFSRAKVESIVALRDFKVKSASIDMQQSLNGDADNKYTVQKAYNLFKKVINGLEDGVYFTRMLCQSENYKKEEFGHSLIFIKDKSQSYLWDPSDGLYEFSGKEHIRDLFTGLMNVSERWLLSAPRFYRISKKEKETQVFSQTIAKAA